MDALASIGSSIAGVFTNPSGGPNLGNILKTVITGGGLLGDVLNMRQQQQSLNKLLYYQRNPSAAAAAINSMTQPLSQGLTQGVENNVQGYLGERGLADSPTITAATLGQALAPYYLQNQQTAANEFANILNPAGAGFKPPADLSALFKLWQPTPNVNVPQLPGASTGGTPVNWASAGDYTPFIAPPTFDTSGYNFGDLVSPS